jgi:hypothetical protein
MRWNEILRPRVDTPRRCSGIKPRNNAWKQDQNVVNRNFLFLIIGALAVVSGLLGYRYYQEHQKTSGIQIEIGKGGVSIEEK